MRTNRAARLRAAANISATPEESAGIWNGIRMEHDDLTVNRLQLEFFGAQEGNGRRRDSTRRPRKRREPQRLRWWRCTPWKGWRCGRRRRRRRRRRIRAPRGSRTWIERLTKSRSSPLSPNRLVRWHHRRPPPFLLGILGILPGFSGCLRFNLRNSCPGCIFFGGGRVGFLGDILGVFRDFSENPERSWMILRNPGLFGTRWIT